MKIAVIILGILGSLAFGALGSKWVSDYEANKAQIKSLGKLAASLGGKSTEVDDAIKGVERARTAGYVMIVMALLGLAASLLVGRLRAWRRCPWWRAFCWSSPGSWRCS